MSDTDPYEREAAKAAIKVLQRELAEARELLIKCLSVMPVGYIPTHTAEHLPEMINDLAKALAEETTKCEQLEREIAEAREYADKLAEGLPDGMLPKDVEVLREANCGLAMELTAVTAQRDTLAEALEMVATHTHMQMQCENGYSPQYVAKQALAAAKGCRYE